MLTRISIYVFIILLSNLVAQSLWNNQGHISESSRVNWSNAGLIWDNPINADHVFDVTAPKYRDDNDSNFDGEIKNAIKDAENANGVSIIYFPAGSYTFNNTISINVDSNDSNIIFQGDGSDKTILNFYVGKNNYCFKIYGKQDLGPIYLNSGIQKGEKIISGNGINNLNVGDWIRLCEYSHGVADDWAQHSIGQITQIVNIEGNTAELKDEASKDYSFGNNLRIWRIKTIKNIGIEKLTINRNDNGYTTNATGSNIFFIYAVNCWVKGVQFNYTCRHHIDIRYSSCIEVSGCYLNDANFKGDGGFGYGVVLNFSTTNCLIQNNIFRKLRHSMVVQAGANCNVFTYNYSREQEWNYPIQGADICIHGNFPYSNLFEENNVEYIKADDEHGMNGPFNTFVRNIVYNDDENYLYFIGLLNAKHCNILGCNNGNANSDPFVYPPLGYEYTPDTDIYGFEMYIDNIPYYPWNHNNSYIAGERPYLLMKDISYYYSSRPDFLDVSYGNYSWPSCGPAVHPDDNITQSIPARERWFY
ncbi:hypothetical protein Calab_3452 [Caldithrix abyssi DSM 13497]|uniref:Endo-1,3-1,4-beta-glucanase n=1 Tax=Caldithrix abyssi DSM 13497 TaxID=880073 RepID=H1XWS5_CALAY|nr:glycosyl hydrolase family 28-related protein [Caldithrix abyssi]APF19123.1 endo-1,3-1,4-beta-glucanase [Caldithrix abyssi DSM 13497]EHO43051.1 hypothetical protein Calab_3452 [Caldithrix abyssi DSM 13497]